MTVVQDTSEGALPGNAVASELVCGRGVRIAVARIAELLVEATSNQGASGARRRMIWPGELRNEAEKAKLESQAKQGQERQAFGICMPGMPRSDVGDGGREAAAFSLPGRTCVHG